MAVVSKLRLVSVAVIALLALGSSAFADDQGSSVQTTLQISSPNGPVFDKTPTNPPSYDIGDLIKNSPECKGGRICVVVPVPDSPNEDYGLLSMAPQDFANKTQLTDPTKLENSYFQIVGDEGSETLPVGDFDGDNVLYHLTLARNYYEKLSENSGFDDPAIQHKIVVRVRVDHGYNLVTHFAQWNDYNNSRYIPASFAGDPDGQWNQEIWFDSQKSQLAGVDWYSIAVSAGLAAASQSWVSLSATPLQILNQYNAGIDASKQPGVIYHECFHYASDAQGLFPMASEGNPVAEDYANYFGASILGRAQIADLMEYSGRFYKRDYSKIRAVTDTRPLYNNYNAIPFGPSVMWQIREWLGQEKADQLIWNSLKYINGTFLETDEEKAISAAAHSDPQLNPDEVAQVEGLLKKYHQSYVNLELKANPGELQIIDDQAAQKAAQKVAGDSTELQTEAGKPDFRQKVVLALDTVAHGIIVGSEDVAKGLGWAGSAIFSAGNAPVDFGTDLATGIFLGHGLLSDNYRTGPSEAIGAAGGVGTVYYTYVGLDALGFTLADPVITGSFADVMVNTLLCSSADPNGITQRDRYCAENSKIMGTISGATARAGARIGEAIHREVLRVKNFFVNAFRKKAATQPPVLTDAVPPSSGAASENQLN